MGAHARHRRLGRVGGGIAVTVVLMTAAACGNSRDSSQGEETVPRITPTTSATTLPAATVATTTTTVALTSPPTATPATPATPFPTSATPPPPTEPPVTQPPVTQPPVTQPPVTDPPPTQPPLNQPPATRPLTTPAPITLPPGTPAPPTTVVVTAGDPALCTDAAVGAATGLLTVTDVACGAGWAIGHDVTCPATQECEGLDVFHVTSAGWVHDGYFPAMCAEALTASGMSIFTAASFVGTYCGDPPDPTEILRPDATGERVVHLQTALIAQGYPIAADGTYGPRTEAAVRDFQSVRGLEVDGIAGPQTQLALGIGPVDQPPATSTTTPVATGPPTSGPTPTSAPATATTVVGLGDLAECTAAAIGADVGRDIAEVTACHAGWALGQITSCASTPCQRADLFRLSESGWAFIRPVRYECAEDLHDAGMSAYTAADFAPWCGVPNLPPQRFVIEPGSVGIVVEQLQVSLVALGYDIAVDGTYGPGTEQAVRDVQRRNGLEVDGIAGPATRELLGL